MAVCDGAVNEWTESLPQMSSVVPARWFSAVGAVNMTGDLEPKGTSSAAESCLVVFGGVRATCSWYPFAVFLDGVQCTPAVLNDTWLFCERDKSWSSVDIRLSSFASYAAGARQSRAGASPPARIGHTMSRAPSAWQSMLVLFGGFHADGTSSRRGIATLNDTWIFQSAGGKFHWRRVDDAASRASVPATGFHSAAVVVEDGAVDGLASLVVVGGADAEQREDMAGQVWASKISLASGTMVASRRLANVTCPQPFGSLFPVANSSSLLYVCLQWDGQRRPGNVHWTQSGVGSLQVWRLGHGVMGDFSGEWEMEGSTLDNFAFSFFNYYRPRGVRLPIVQLPSSLYGSHGQESIVLMSVESSAMAHPGSVLAEVIMFNVGQRTWKRLKASQWSMTSKPGTWIWTASTQLNNVLFAALNTPLDSTQENFTSTLASVTVDETSDSFSVKKIHAEPDIAAFGVAMMAAVTTNKTALVFGGLTAGTDGELGFVDNITWQWDVLRNVWGRTSYSTAGPSARIGHTFTMAAPERVAVLHGGCYCSNMGDSCKILPDTWLLNINNWQWTKLDGDFSGRAAHAAFYSRGSVFSVGGLSKTSELAAMDLWQLSSLTKAGASWTKVAISGDGPPSMYGHSLLPVTSNTGSTDVYLIGGALCMSSSCFSRPVGSMLNTDVWHFSMNERKWTNLSAVAVQSGVGLLTSPGKRAFHAAAVIGAKLVVHGGCLIEVCLFSRQDLVQVYSCCRDLHVTRGSPDDDLLWVFDTQTKTWTWLETAGQIGHRLMHVFVADSTTINLLGGLDKTWEYVKSLNPVSVCAGKPCQATLGCNPGAACRDFSTETCQLCAVGTFAPTAGLSSCAACPALTTSIATGAASISNCSVCHTNACHGHGTCNVQSETFAVTCSCQFGYSSSGRCQSRSSLFYVFLSLASVIGFVLLAGVAVGVRRRIRGPVPYDFLSSNGGEASSAHLIGDDDPDG